MKAIDKIVDMVIEGLENGVVPWRKTWKDFFPMNAISKKQYRGFNTFFLSLFCSQYGYRYPLFATFKQISEAGGYVKKGEKSFPVVFWKATEESIENDVINDNVSKKRFVLRYYNVFNLDQTFGIDIEKCVPEFAARKAQPLETCETVISGMPNPPAIEHDKPGAFYMPGKDIVNVPEIGCFDAPENYYGVTFHELAHSTGHESRLNRFTDNKTFYGANSYDYEELVAEMTATLLCSHCGIEQNQENSVSYLKNWAKFLKNERKTTLFGAATKAQKAAGYILGNPVENELTS